MVKLKKPDPTGKRKFRLKPHQPDEMTKVPLPNKIDKCLQNATGRVYNAGLGQVIISLSDGSRICVLDPLSMHQFVEKDANKLASLPLVHGEHKKREAEQYLSALQENLDYYNLYRLSFSYEQTFF